MTARDRLEALLAGVELADLDDLLGRPGWQALAACAGLGPELFFAEEPEALGGTVPPLEVPAPTPLGAR